jgi:ketosteroid isomerase-like protein
MNTRNLVNELVEMVQRGQILDAFERFYAEDVSMRENVGAPTIGKSANRDREIAFVNSVKEVHENRAAFALVDGDRAVINWRLDFTNTQGQRLRFDQLAVQRWENGQIVEERFVYDTGALAVPETQEAVLA